MTAGGRKVAQVARDRAVEHHISRGMMLIPPWIGAFLVLPAGAILHKGWPHWWAALAILFAAFLLGVLAWCTAHDRSRDHRMHLAATIAATALFLAAADLFGFGSAVWFCWIVVIWSVALSWNIRGGARHGAMQEMLGHVLGAAHESAGLEGATVQIKGPSGRALKAQVRGVPGAHTAKDIGDRAAYVESAAGLAPGSLAYAPDDRDRGVAGLTISDPRSIEEPRPYPGAYAAGASVAQPLRVGLWQTGADALMRLVPVFHLIIAGMTGAAKSTGWGWSILAELITRHDVKVYAADITKGDQTLGPFRPCLATDAPGCEQGILTERGDVARFLAWVQAQIRPRTDYLAGKGLQAWREGCGIPLIVVWLEEAPDIVNALTDDQAEEWVSSMKAARSAGIMFVYSCQRPDWTQLPTIARAQFAGRVACGVNTSGDADLCLTERQGRANVEPEQWADRKPAMAYLDGPWVTDEFIAIAARSWYWGGDDVAIRAHCAQFARNPAQEADMRWPGTRPRIITDDAAEDWPPGRAASAADHIAEQIIGDVDRDDPIDPANMAAVEHDPADGDWEFGDDPAGQVPADLDPVGEFDAWLAARLAAGNATFRAGDLADLRAQIGRSRSWLYDELGRRTSLGQLRRGEGTWTVVKAA